MTTNIDTRAAQDGDGAAAPAAGGMQGRATSVSPGLLPQHATLLKGSIPASVMEARGYRSVSIPDELGKLGFKKAQRRVPALLIPVRDVTGTVAHHILRPDSPRVDKKGKVVKYEMPAGKRNVLDIPAASSPSLGDAAVPLYITEAPRKADALVGLGLCAVALNGVWGGCCKNQGGGKEALTDWDSIQLLRREVFIAFDSDIASNSQVRLAAQWLKAFLVGRGARVWFLVLPVGEAGAKVGVDDFIAAGHVAAEFPALAVKDLPAEPLPEVDEDGRPIVTVAQKLTFITDKVLKILKERWNEVPFTRGGLLVRVVPGDRGPDVNAEVGVPIIEPLLAPALADLLDRKMHFMKFDARKMQYVESLPPDWVVQNILARGEYQLPQLNGVITSPTFRPDGSVLSTSGYDPGTGLLADIQGTFPAVPDNPTGVEVDAALEFLLAPFSEFPFVDDPDRAVVLALILTLVSRHAYEGRSPLFVAEAPTPGTGKGLLITVVMLIAMGRKPMTLAPSQDEQEMRKLILSIAMEERDAVLLDNLVGTLSSPTLCAALTTDGAWTGRLLGQNKNMSLPLRTVFTATANNLSYSQDMARRVLRTRLDARKENPEDRTFTRADLRAYVAKEWRALHIAALTILRGYHMAGRPGHGKSPLGSFEGWDALVRGAIKWCYKVDPCESRAALREECDADREALDILLKAWFRAFNTEKVTSAQVRTKAETDFDLREALAAFDTEKKKPSVSLSDLGYLLRRSKGKVVGNLVLERVGKAAGGAQWKVASVDGADDDDDSDDARRRPAELAAGTPENRIAGTQLTLPVADLRDRHHGQHRQPPSHAVIPDAPMEEGEL